jgi:hypothetical protein
MKNEAFFVMGCEKYSFVAFVIFCKPLSVKQKQTFPKRRRWQKNEEFPFPSKGVCGVYYIPASDIPAILRFLRFLSFLMLK